MGKKQPGAIMKLKIQIPASSQPEPMHREDEIIMESQRLAGEAMISLDKTDAIIALRFAAHQIEIESASRTVVLNGMTDANS